MTDERPQTGEEQERPQTSQGLDALDMKESRVVEIRKPNGDPLGIYFTLASPYSEVFQRSLRKGRDRMQQFQRELGNPRRLKPDQRIAMQELQESLALDRLIECVLGWSSDEHPGTQQGMSGKVLFRGVAMEHNQTNVKSVLTALPFLREQLGLEMLDEEGFTKA